MSICDSFALSWLFQRVWCLQGIPGTCLCAQTWNTQICCSALTSCPHPDVFPHFYLLRSSGRRVLYVHCCDGEDVGADLPWIHICFGKLFKITLLTVATIIHYQFGKSCFCNCLPLRPHHRTQQKSWNVSQCLWWSHAFSSYKTNDLVSPFLWLKQLRK